uniref:Transcriptional regulator n=1 Tax=Steinernema glaseri TaxID=37863 RepID=A0A1I7ZHW7_9BILA
MGIQGEIAAHDAMRTAAHAGGHGGQASGSGGREADLEMAVGLHQRGQERCMLGVRLEQVPAQAIDQQQA